MISATEANSPERWDELWSNPKTRDWREEALSPIYDRIVELMPNVCCDTEPSSVVDMGGGVGHLGSRLRDRGYWVEVWDISGSACKQARRIGLYARRIDLEAFDFSHGVPAERVIATEVLEHLTERTRRRLLEVAASRGAASFFSVPNNRLGPDEEPQHTIKWTCLEFLNLLREYWPDARVECFGGYLLGICSPEKKPFKLSVCFPARDEDKDIERTLQSFRGVADEIVVGVDPRSTDRTEEIARQYAEKVFILEKPEGKDGAPTDVHFSDIRNQCIEKCDGDWIFMTEAHEHLEEGIPELLSLDTIADHIKAIFVWRRGMGRARSIQRWMFPWLFRNIPELRFERRKHNILPMPEGHAPTYMPAVATFHKRHPDNAVARSAQRKKHNRLDLFSDWLKTANANSLFYAASETREEKPATAMRMFQELLALPTRNGPRSYQARLILAKLLAFDGEDFKAAKETLHECSKEDWSRIDHWIFLGDLCVLEKNWEEAITYYTYAAAKCGDMPISMWWIDEAFYTYIPPQRLSECFARIGNAEQSLFWARRFKEELEALGDAPEEALAEVEKNIGILEEAINEMR